MTMIKKPLAYISAAWSGTETENMEAALPGGVRGGLFPDLPAPVPAAVH